MLLDQAKDLATKIGDYTRLKSNAGAAREFETRAGQFVAVADALERTRQSIKRMTDAGIALDFAAKDGAGLAEKAVTLRTALIEDPAKLNVPPFNLKYEFIDRLNSLCSAADSTLLTAWRAHVVANSETASPDVLTALGAVPQYQSVVERIRVLKGQIATLTNGVPADIATGVAQLKMLMDSYRAAWEEMAADGIPADVIGFLRAAAGNGAALDLLTDEVRTWLEARKLLSLFRIKI